MNNRLDGQEAAFGNAGTTRPGGRAQRMQDRSGHVDDMVQETKIPRPRIRRKRPGAANPNPHMAPLPRR